MRGMGVGDLFHAHHHDGQPLKNPPPFFAQTCRQYTRNLFCPPSQAGVDVVLPWLHR